MTHAILLIARLDDGRERSTRHRTVQSARARVQKLDERGDPVAAAPVYREQNVVARYSRYTGWSGDLR